MKLKISIVRLCYFFLMGLFFVVNIILIIYGIQKMDTILFFLLLGMLMSLIGAVYPKEKKATILFVVGWIIMIATVLVQNFFLKK